MGCAARECPPEPPEGGMIGGNEQGMAPDGGESVVLGQVLSARDHADLLALLRYEDELEAFTLGTGVGAVDVVVEAFMEVDDPFGFAEGDFDSP